jgi:hypothetical protein
MAHSGLLDNKFELGQKTKDKSDALACKSYYSATAYDSTTTYQARFFIDSLKVDYPVNEYSRLQAINSLSGKDIIATRDSVAPFSRTPTTKKEKSFLKVTDTLLMRVNHKYEKEYFGSKYNHTGFFYFFAYMGYIMCTFGTILMLISYPFSYFAGVYSNWTDFFFGFEYIGAVCAGSFVLWKVADFIASKLPDKKYRTMNRRTGMLTFPQKGNKPDIEIPYAEFEPRVSRYKVPSGYHHSLVYVHKSGAPLFWAGERFLADVYLKAAYLEQFMDVSRPLPDIPSLEWCRDKDPTTVADDMTTHRDPNHWRNMTYGEMEALGKKRRIELSKVMGEAAFIS